MLFSIGRQPVAWKIEDFSGVHCKVDRRILRSGRVLKGERNEKQTYLRLYRRRMKAGQPLRQEELSEKLGYSRMPVREALQILEEQGLVRRLATRHVVVADFSERNIEEIFDMFGNVEKKALKDLAEMSFEWVYSAEGEDAEEKFHEFVYGTITNGLFRRLLETSADCYIRFASEETEMGKDPEQKQLRRNKLETVHSAYCRKDTVVMEVALEEYYRLLTENVKKERGFEK